MPMVEKKVLVYQHEKGDGWHGLVVVLGWLVVLAGCLLGLGLLVGG